MLRCTFAGATLQDLRSARSGCPLGTEIPMVQKRWNFGNVDLVAFRWDYLSAKETAYSVGMVNILLDIPYRTWTTRTYNVSSCM